MSEIMPVASDTKATINVQDLITKAECYNSYIEQTQKMQWIEGEMRETPPPKSEVLQGQPKNNLKRVEFPPQGGVMTYMEGFDEPYQGFPLHTLVERLDLVKKMTKGFKSGFYHIIWKHFNGWKKYPMMIITYPFFKIYSRAEIYSCWRHIERFRVKPKCYCQAVREIYRAFSIPTSDNEKFKDGVMREQIRDILCMHLEFDNAYRYRFQDCIGELDKKNLKKNPIKEMLRMFDVVSEREVHQEVKDSWTLTKWMIEYLRFDKTIKKILLNYLLNLDVEKCKLSKEDTPYCLGIIKTKGREDYNFKSVKF